MKAVKLKLFILDADIIIDLFSFNMFDNLAKHCNAYAASTVIDEVKYFEQNGRKIKLNFRDKYIESGIVKEVSVGIACLKNIILKLPKYRGDSLDAGELESLAALIENTEITFCTCDAAAIRTLPYIDLSQKGISLEKLLKTLGLITPKIKNKHSEEYFKYNLKEGEKERILHL